MMPDAWQRLLQVTTTKAYEGRPEKGGVTATQVFTVTQKAQPLG